MERVLEEVVMQGLGLTGSGLILAGFEGGHVVELSHFPSHQSSQDEDITVFTIGVAGMELQGWSLGWFVSLCWFGPELGTVHAKPRYDIVCSHAPTHKCV